MARSSNTKVAITGRDLLRQHESANGPVPVGEQVRFSHADCGDARDRLYVKRVVTDHGIRGVLAYCHNCGAGGRAPDAAGYVPLAITSVAPIGDDVLPKDMSQSNQIAIDYMAKYGFSAADIGVFGVGWSDHYQRIVLPVQDQSGHKGPVKGCQLRRVGGYGAKYITMRPTSEPLECQWGQNLGAPTVIVEDLLSAWRVWQAGFNAIPLLGSHVRPERLAKVIHEGFTDWVVWLDNDTPEINDAARYMVNLIKALGGSALLCRAANEPKKCDVATVIRHVTVTSREYP